MQITIYIFVFALCIFKMLGLGIIFDRKMTFDVHMNYIMSRSISMLEFFNFYIFWPICSKGYLLFHRLVCFRVWIFYIYLFVWPYILSPNFEVHKGEEKKENFWDFPFEILVGLIFWICQRIEIDMCYWTWIHLKVVGRDAFCVLLIHDVIEGLIDSSFSYSIFAFNFPTKSHLHQSRLL
jgi:hypothetical protein